MALFPGTDVGRINSTTCIALLAMVLAPTMVGLANAQSYSPFPNGVQAAAVVKHSSGGSRLIVAPLPGPNITSGALCSVANGEWEVCGYGLPFPLYITDFLNLDHTDGRPSTLIASAWGNDVVYHSEDGGLTFEASTVSEPAGWVAVYSLSPSPFGDLYGSGPLGRVYKSEDDGVSWSRSGQAPVATIDGLESPDEPWALLSHPRIAGVLFGHIPGRGVYASRDDGETWDELSPNLPTLPRASAIKFSPLSEEALFAATGNGLWRIRLDNEGTAVGTWEEMSLAGLDSVSVTRIAFAEAGTETPEGALLVGTRENGAWLSLDPLATTIEALSPVPTSGPNITTLMAFQGGGFFVGTKFDGTEMVLGAVFATSRDRSPIPRSMQLGQNFPNPFRSSTSIPLSLDAPGPVTLQVFDSLGREVARPVSWFLQAGQHTVPVDAADWAAGIYSYRLTVESLSVHRLLHVIR